MKIEEYLNQQGVKYDVTKHKPAFSAQRMAAARWASTFEPTIFAATTPCPVVISTARS